MYRGHSFCLALVKLLFWAVNKEAVNLHHFERKKEKEMDQRNVMKRKMLS
jgi:hypothetical protein